MEEKLTRQDLKDYVYSQKWIDEEIQKYREQRARVENISPNMSGMPSGKNHVSYALENLIDKHDELLEIIAEDQEKQNRIIKQIRQLDEPYRNILLDKYILGKSLQTISNETPRAYDNICRLHGIALKMFDELGNKESRQFLSGHISN